MTTVAVLASGPSMSQAVADAVRGRVGVVAVSDCYRLAPWADALVSQDRAWWKHHVAAHGFAGRKFCGPNHEIAKVDGLEQVAGEAGILTSTNSGLLGCHVAVRYLGATRVLLCGFDMGGSHFFGPHPTPLKNTSTNRFEVFKRQFAEYRPKGVEIINCTPGSALTCYPMASLESLLASMAESSLHAG